MSKQGVPQSGLERSQDEAELASLMRRAQTGDSESYKVLLTRINEMLGTYVKRSFEKFGLVSTGGFEDVVQEILIGIHCKRQSFDSEQYFLPWMYAIARYKIVDFIRKNGRQIRMSVPIEDELENLEAVITHDLGAGHDVIALCAGLPEKQGRILKLVKIDGLSISEAAAKTGYSANDIKINVHRALKTLQRQVAEGDDEH